MARPASLTERFVVVSFLIGLVRSTCFYPDGSSDSGHIACGSSGTSVCCAEGFQCLSNGLCADPRYDNWTRVLRGGCTDKSWGTGCPQMCTSNWPQGDEAVYYCGSGKFCCGNSDDCCSDSSVEKLNLGEPKVVAIAGESTAETLTAKAQDASTTAAAAATQQQQTQAPASSKQQQPAPAPSASSPKQVEQASSVPIASSQARSSQDSPSNTQPSAVPTTVISQSDSSLELATVTVVSDHTIGASPTGANDPATATQTVPGEATDHGAKNTVAIGVGVGVGVGVIVFLCVIGACVYMRRKKQREQQAGVTSRGVGNGRMDTFESRDYEGLGSRGTDGDGKKDRPFGRGSGVLHELDGHRGVELPEKTDPREIDGRELERPVEGDLERNEKDENGIELMTWPV